MGSGRRYIRGSSLALFSRDGGAKLLAIAFKVFDYGKHTV